MAAKMTENSRKVFDFLKANNNVQITGQEIAKELDVTINAVTGSVNGLVKKGFAVREEVTAADDAGKPKITKYIKLTDAGMAFDPDAVEEKAE